jgi:8-oxo-dGTP diphosphatase
VVRTEGTEIPLVKHRWHDGTTSWILPGGALLPGETPEEAVLRELDEETSLKGTIVRFLFTMPYDLGTSATFLVEVDATAQVSLGYSRADVIQMRRPCQEWTREGSIMDIGGSQEKKEW